MTRGEAYAASRRLACERGEWAGWQRGRLPALPLPSDRWQGVLGLSPGCSPPCRCPRLRWGADGTQLSPAPAWCAIRLFARNATAMSRDGRATTGREAGQMHARSKGEGNARPERGGARGNPTHWHCSELIKAVLGRGWLTGFPSSNLPNLRTIGRRINLIPSFLTSDCQSPHCRAKEGKQGVLVAPDCLQFQVPFLLLRLFPKCLHSAYMSHPNKSPAKGHS